MNYPPSGFTFPDISGEVASQLQELLYLFVDAFDAHYCRRIEKYHRQLLQDAGPLILNEGQDPL